MDKLEIINQLKLEIANIDYSIEPNDLLNYGQDWTRFNQVNAACVLFPQSLEHVQTIEKDRFF